MSIAYARAALIAYRYLNNRDDDRREDYARKLMRQFGRVASQAAADGTHWARSLESAAGHLGTAGSSIGGAGGANVSISAPGARQLAKDLDAMAAQVDREMTAALIAGAVQMRNMVSAYAPRRTGRLAASIQAYSGGPRASTYPPRARPSATPPRARPSATPPRAVVSSPLPYASVHEFGGRVGRHHATTIRPRAYAKRGMEAGATEVERRIEGMLGQLAERHGF